MARIVTVGAAQLGPIARAEPRRSVVKRLVAHLEQARARGCDLVVFPELALTTFFPRWAFDGPTVSSAASQAVSSAASQAVSSAASQAVSSAASQAVSSAPSQAVSSVPSQAVSSATSQAVSSAASQAVSSAPSQAELDAFFEREMPGPETEVLFAEARRLGLGFSLGYAELTTEGGRPRRFNTSILVGPDGAIIGKYRKIHLPGHAEVEPWRPFQHLEKRYFEVGDLGFGVWRAFGGVVGMCICADRRWPETWRVLGLQGVELVLVGYNTPEHHPPAPEHDRLAEFHSRLVMQAGAYQNGTWVVGVAKAGREEGCEMIGGTAVIAPSGEVVARAVTREDELVVAAIDLDLCRSYQTTIFDFARHRQPEHYRMIVERRAAVPPP